MKSARIGIVNSTNTNIINPKPCNYNCGTRIYWNTSENAYFEVFSGTDINILIDLGEI